MPASRRSVEETIARWRRVCIANTVAGLVMIVVGIVFLPAGLAVAVDVLMLLSVADCWYLGRRIPLTGNIFIRPTRAQRGRGGRSEDGTMGP